MGDRTSQPGPDVIWSGTVSALAGRAPRLVVVGLLVALSTPGLLARRLAPYEYPDLSGAPDAAPPPYLERLGDVITSPLGIVALVVAFVLVGVLGRHALRRRAASIADSAHSAFPARPGDVLVLTRSQLELGSGVDAGAAVPFEHIRHVSKVAIELRFPDGRTSSVPIDIDMIELARIRSVVAPDVHDPPTMLDRALTLPVFAYATTMVSTLVLARIMFDFERQVGSASDGTGYLIMLAFLAIAVGCAGGLVYHLRDRSRDPRR